MDVYSVWLMLEKDSRSSYRDLIIKLSKKLKTPSFDPHCTLYGRLDLNIDQIRPTVIDLVKTTIQFSTNVKMLKTGKTKWKSLYLSLDNNEDLRSLYGQCKKKFGPLRRYAFDPPRSIAYGIFDPASIHYATKNIIIPEYLAFSAIAIVKTGENIRDWEVVFQRQFESG